MVSHSFNFCHSAAHKSFRNVTKDVCGYSPLFHSLSFRLAISGIGVQFLKRLTLTTMTTNVMHLTFALYEEGHVFARHIQIFLWDNFRDQPLHGQGKRFVSPFVTTRFGGTIVQGKFQGLVRIVLWIRFFLSLQVLE